MRELVSVRMLSLHLMLKLADQRRQSQREDHEHEREPQKVKLSSISVLVASDLGNKSVLTKLEFFIKELNTYTWLRRQRT